MGDSVYGHEYTWIQGRHLRWDVYPGCCGELYNLVEVAAGKTVGRVRGSSFRPDIGWEVVLMVTDTHLAGTYTTLKAAKTVLLKAVETVFAKEDSDAQRTINEVGKTGTATETR